MVHATFYEKYLMKENKYVINTTRSLWRVNTTSGCNEPPV
jgi:hypothetical protein